jgi:hypothetical protein
VNRPVPHISGTLTGVQLTSTAHQIASHQRSDGLIPWFDGHHADPWDHIEAAMALTVCGLDDVAARAFEWSANNQSADGSWPMEIVVGGVRDASTDANQCAYLATGVWHHWLITGDRRLTAQMWPVVRQAINFVVDLQQPSGSISWARSPSGEASADALLTGSACIVLSLRCALALAEWIGDPQPHWELAASRLAHAVAIHPETFQDRSRYSMDWYYPVLGGAVRGQPALSHINRRWNEFAVASMGIRCVADQPWVTAAESCELALALDAVGETERARVLLHDIQFLRAENGGYWTGYVWPDQAIWPEEQSTWSAAAVILAADAIARCSAGSGLFRGDRLPRLSDQGAAACGTQCLELTGPIL